jgi:3-phenylpropionate/trans-cinnamate dioxygenase ferredoxin component
MNNEFVKVGKQSEISPGAVKVFAVQGLRIAICHVEQSFYAVADLCTHDGGPLGEGELIDDQIECPRHGARFDIQTGKAMCLPAVTAIPVYKVELRGEDLWVALPVGVGSEAKG